MSSIEFVTSQYSKIFWLEASSRSQEEQDRYHIYGVFEYTIQPNFIRLNDSLQAIVNTHYNLRSTFKEHADDLIQVVHHNILVKLDSYVVHSNDECNALIRKIIELPFDLINGPLFRFTCIQNIATNSTIFIPNFHHIIIDGTQFDKLMEKISHHYHYTPNLAEHDQDCVAQLQAYITWEAEQIKRADLQYWIKKAENYPLEINLPYKHSLVDKIKSKENAALYRLDDELYDRVQQFSSKIGCSIFEIFKTVWALLICQYSNQTKIIITYPINTRRKGFKSVKGAFLNACLFFFEVGGSFRSCISDQKKDRRDIHHRYISIIEILSRLENAAFKCAISQADLAISGPSLESSPGYRFKIGLGSTDLCMFLNTMGPSLQFGLVAAQNLFDSSMLDRLSKNFSKLLSRIIDNPDMDLAVLSCLTNDEYDLVVNQWNKTITPYPQAAISRLFEEQVLKNPHNTAILYQNCEFSYQEINEKANQLARYIRHEYLMTTKNQLVGDVLIPICMGRSVEFVIALLAILKAGAAYVPIDPKHPKRRIQRLLDDINAPLMLTEHQLIIKIRSLRPKVKLIWQDKNVLAKEDVNNLDNVVVPSQLAYVIYTSGTTGQPKGVMIQHNSVVSLVKGVTYFNASETDTFAFFSDVAFDAATFELWGALLNGSRLFIPDNHLQIILDSSLFKKCLVKNNITVLWLTKTVFDLLFSSDETLFSTLNYLLVGGESLNKDYMQSLLNSPYKPKHIINGYGPTENTTFSCTYDINPTISHLSSVPIGKPLSNRICYVLDKNLKPQPIGAVGELYVGGAGLARGYLNNAELNRERFIKNPFSKDQDELFSRFYKTEDYVKWLPNGDLEYISRQDSQIKLRGYRIELQEIESQLLMYPGIKQSLILLKEMRGDKYLIAYYVSDYQLDEEAIRSFLAKHLPHYMIPNIFLYLNHIPFTSNGKIDKKALPLPFIQPNLVLKCEDFQSIEDKIQAIWSTILSTSSFNKNLSFFDLGGTSLKIMKVKKELEIAFELKINIVDLFQHTTLNQLSQHVISLKNSFKKEKIIEQEKKESNSSIALKNESIAIIGMACRLPGGIVNPESFWKFLLVQDSTICDFSDEELRQQHISELLLANESFVKRGSILENAHYFDANFFGYSERDAELMDPQQRHFLECAWEALENSGNVPEKFVGDIGVFASQGKNYYYTDYILSNPEYKEKVNAYQAMLGNEKDFLATKVSFKLNLSGPSLTLQTGCSSSLVSVQMACSSLKNNECDMALAGGVSLFNKYGYLYQEDMIESPDGYCRAFDIDAKGTVAGSGVGVIVLKRLSDAIQQGDKIYAVIKGGAVNNDGSSKIGYTAPSISGQERVIQKALKNAGANPDTIGYIEAHGTGTQLGDPIELRALHNIYEQYLDQSKGCAIGSVKTNIGHTDAAAGIFGLIKTVLILKNKIIPATLHFKQFNPEISAFNKIFFVPNKSIYWESDKNLRRAAISSFGIGGTNAHLILEEYLEPERIKPESKPVLIPFSAKNQKSLWTKANQLKQYLHTFGKANFLNDIAFTAQEGRAEFKERGYFIVKSSVKEKSVCIKEFFIRDHFFYEKLQWIYILSPENTISSYSLAIQLKFLHWLCSVGVPPNGIVLSENIANKEFAIIQTDIDLYKIKIFNHVDNIIQDSTMESIFVEIGPNITLDEKYVLRRTILSEDQDDHNLAYLSLIGWLWSHGIWIPWNKIDPSSFLNNKIAIPSYAFNRKLYEIPKINSESKLKSDEIISAEIKVSPEFQLKKVWSEVLGVSSVDLNQKTDFFDLGGDSLALIDILERMKRKFLCDITLEEIMMNCEFGSMANLFTSKIKEKCE